MLNAEKYKKDVEKVNYCFAITNNELINCFKLHTCADCKFDKTLNCGKERIKWLLQEYKEPILTDKEKAYLKNVIEPQRNDIAYVTKWVYNPRKENEYFPLYVYMRNRYNSNYVFRLLEFITTKDMPFEGLETLKIYTLEELGL